MKRFTTAIEQSLADGNWYAALTLALTLPDICGRLETPTMGSQKRYAVWWDKYCLARYTVLGRKFLTGDDAYALRCSYLHEGGDDTTHQRARRDVSKFRFIAPVEGFEIHRNFTNNALQLQVDIFCGDICAGVNTWSQAVTNNSDIQERLKALLHIEVLNKDFIEL